MYWFVEYWGTMNKYLEERIKELKTYIHVNYALHKYGSYSIQAIVDSLMKGDSVEDALKKVTWHPDDIRISEMRKFLTGKAEPIVDIKMFIDRFADKMVLLKSGTWCCKKDFMYCVLRCTDYDFKSGYEEFVDILFNAYWDDDIDTVKNYIDERSRKLRACNSTEAIWEALRLTPDEDLPYIKRHKSSFRHREKKIKYHIEYFAEVATEAMEILDWESRGKVGVI